jgi:hypothetical protein
MVGREINIGELQQKQIQGMLYLGFFFFIAFW